MEKDSHQVNNKKSNKQVDSLVYEKLKKDILKAAAGKDILTFQEFQKLLVELSFIGETKQTPTETN